MISFEGIERIIVTANTDLVGRTGRVVRLRINDSGAWVQMDQPLPNHLRSFPEGDERADWIVLYPEWCGLAPKGDV